MTLPDKPGAALGWNEPLPKHFKKQWASLNALATVSVPHVYCPNPMSENSCHELHIFFDASTEAIGVCSYLWIGNGEVIVSFVAGKQGWHRCRPQVFHI